MDELILRCACCMHERTEPGPCAHCGSETDPAQDFACLPLHTVLNNRYYIGMPLRRTGESNVYLAFDNEYSCVCLVREFYAPTIVKRNSEDNSIVPFADCDALFNTYRSEFHSLWTKIKKLKGLPGLVNISDVFEANNTVYAVTPNSDDITLREFMSRQPGGKITWEQARILFVPLFSTLATLHSAGIVHRGLSPETICVDRSGRLRIFDFAVADARLAKTNLDPELFDGYCAFEQYTPGRAIGPWTDVYAFSAVLYRCLTGIIPVAAPFRAVEDTMSIPANIAQVIPPYAINAVIDGMEINALERVQNMDELRVLIAAPTEYVPQRKSMFEEEAYYPTDAQLNEQEEPLPEDEPLEEEQTDAFNEETQEPPVADIEEPQSEDDEKKKKTGLDKAITVLLIVILVITVVGLGFVVKYLSSFMQGDPIIQDPAYTESTITVPNCIGLTMQEIENTPDIMNNFTVRFVTVTGSSRTYGQIDSQSLSYGDAVQVGSELVLSVSSLAMPDLTGKSEVQAKAALDAYGISYLVDYKQYSEGDKSLSGTVFHTTPSNGTPIIPGENRMYAKDGQYYDVLITVWNYGVLSSEVVTPNPNTQTQPYDNNINIDLNFGSNSVG